MKRVETFYFLVASVVIIVLQTTNIFAASTNYTETWDNNSLAEWTANTYASNVAVESSGGNPNGYLLTWGTLWPDGPYGETFDIGAMTQCPVFTGDFSSAGVTGMSVDMRFISGTFDWAWLRLRYKDASHNGWMYSLTDTFGNTWQTYSVNFSPDWNDVEAEAAGWHPDNYWLSGSSDSNSWQETLSDVYYTEVRISGVNDVNAGIDNFSIILAEDICGGPDEVDLCAGQDDPVGTVTVKNDGNNLTVTYDTNDGWYLVETHLAVAESLDGIPQTQKKGKGKGNNLSKANPIPGDFPYGDNFNPADMNTSASYVIDMNSEGFEPDDLLYIAAHAVVQKIDVILAAPYGASSIADVNQGLRKNGTPVTTPRSDPNAVLADDSDFFSLGFGGEIIVAFDCPIENRDGNDIVIVEVTGGNRLTYPLETVEVYGGADAAGPWTYLGDANSHNEETYLDLNGLTEAAYIRIVDNSDPTPHSASADAFDLDFVGSLQDCIGIAEETAWGDGCEGVSFPGKNWATYFTFTVGACEECSQEP